MKRYFVLIVLGLVLAGCKETVIENRTERINVTNSNSASNTTERNENVSLDNKTSNSPASSATPDKAQREEVIKRYLAGVAKVSKAIEYEKARIVKYGDLDEDGDEDVVVQFTLEGVGGGGNNYEYRLAAFRNENGKYTGVTDESAGGKLVRDITLQKIEGGRIYLDTKSYKDSDGACCPSIDGKTEYVLKNDKLLEVKDDKK